MVGRSPMITIHACFRSYIQLISTSNSSCSHFQLSHRQFGFEGMLTRPKLYEPSQRAINFSRRNPGSVKPDLANLGIVNPDIVNLVIVNPVIVNPVVANSGIVNSSQGVVNPGVVRWNIVILGIFCLGGLTINHLNVRCFTFTSKK